ncbi:MAG: pyridoxal kinase [Micavibrio aeruginosavorus]|uniref:pyridoxal kinase n=1 Tax=Micavibrio aeruginosavorus TaxID=349221 RepID=A0A2W5HEY8_9BACT|nr:MAG: pyridoxal kinase [Micavibrio aeruginosavorus]
MSYILSIQSHVAFGYVGNKAAIFPLQCLGHDVIDINTVQFSNHTGYGSWTGQIFDPAHIQDLVNGLRDRDILKNIKTIISGYLGSAELGQIVLETVDEIRRDNPDALYCCDPVMGDTGRGFFVKEGIPDFFKNASLPKATIITPNQFELSWLTGIEIRTLEDAKTACRQALQMGPEIVLLTSLEHLDTPETCIQMMVISKKACFMITTPKLPVQVNGSGDCTAALFVGYYLKTGKLDEALAMTASAIYAVFEKTLGLKSREIALIQAQDAFRNPDMDFKPFKVL